MQMSGAQLILAAAQAALSANYAGEASTEKAIEAGIAQTIETHRPSPKVAACVTPKAVLKVIRAVDA